MNKSRFIWYVFYVCTLFRTLEIEYKTKTWQAAKAWYVRRTYTDVLVRYLYSLDKKSGLTLSMRKYVYMDAYKKTPFN
jgi:hypothetical protein